MRRFDLDRDEARHLIGGINEMLLADLDDGHNLKPDIAVVEKSFIADLHRP
jgi:hypothetical protein